MSKHHRLLLYVLVTAAVLLALEALLRWQRALFLGASHRATSKAANYVARGGSDVAFFGSSRTADGVLPAFMEGNVYNLAISSTSIEVLEWLATYAPPPRRLSVVEVSLPQNFSRRPEWLLPLPGADLESQLQAKVAEHVSLFGLRRAFRIDSLGRLLATTFAQRFDGSEIKGIDYMRAVLHERTLPTLTRASGFAKRPVQAVAGTDALAARYLAVAKTLGRVVFYVPPTQAREPLDELLGHLAQTAPVWDLSASQLPAEWYRDLDHLSPQGAAEMSAWLSGELRALQ